jgi:hypothetical protein
MQQTSMLFNGVNQSSCFDDLEPTNVGQTPFGTGKAPINNFFSGNTLDPMLTTATTMMVPTNKKPNHSPMTHNADCKECLFEREKRIVT